MTLYIFTFLTDESRIQYLKHSAELNNMNIQYLVKPNWNGYTDKIFAINEQLKQLNDTDIVCFIDAYDVLVNNNETDILEKFYSYKCNLLIGAELNCYPEHYKEYFPNTSTNSKYVNSGGYIGYVNAIKNIFNWKSQSEIIQISKNGGDQTYFIEYYLNNYLNTELNIKLDDKSMIFQNMHWIDWKELEIIDGKVHNSILNTWPCFIHFNGGTWQQQNGDNIMPILVEKMREKKTYDNLIGFSQIITSTCFPHSQI
jgi:hypothetical protein